MTFSDVKDATKIFATSQPFEVKPQGSEYFSIPLLILHTSLSLLFDLFCPPLSCKAPC